MQSEHSWQATLSKTFLGPMMIGTASAFLSLTVPANADTPNWTAYNDHIRSTNTGNNVSTYSITTTNGAGGPLTNYDTGEVLPAGVSITFEGSVGDTVSTMAPPNPLEGPAGTIFQGKVDFLGGTGIRFPASNWGIGNVAITSSTRPYSLASWDDIKKSRSESLSTFSIG